MRHREAERDRTVRGDCRETDAAASVSAAGCEAGAVYSRRAVKRIVSRIVSPSAGSQSHSRAKIARRLRRYYEEEAPDIRGPSGVCDLTDFDALIGGPRHAPPAGRRRRADGDAD